MPLTNPVVLLLAALAVHTGFVFDAETETPIEGAIVTSGSQTVVTDAKGTFRIPASTGPVGVRAVGYGRGFAEPKQTPLRIALSPREVKAVYLSYWGLGRSTTRRLILDLIDSTELNALVIDFKGDDGLIADPKHLAAVMDAVKGRDIYLIARIVTFKDKPFAIAHPEEAVKTRAGEVWIDAEGLAWTDPFSNRAREHVIGHAVAAAKAGFDEIQFDYVRFPDAAGLAFRQPFTEQTRVAAINRFLDEARAALTPYNVFLAADVFGYVVWNRDDTRIGQRLEDVMGRLDYLSPMLYPSAFRLGIPGVRSPVARPFDVVARSLARAAERTRQPPVRFRPWLQAFRDYAFDRREFGAEEIAAQIRAAEQFGSRGWMLWNPGSVYSTGGLRVATGVQSLD